MRNPLNIVNTARLFLPLGTVGKALQHFQAFLPLGLAKDRLCTTHLNRRAVLGWPKPEIMADVLFVRLPVFSFFLYSPYIMRGLVGFFLIPLRFIKPVVGP